MKQFVSVEAVVENGMHIVTEGGDSEVREHQIENIKPNDIAFIAARDASACRNQVCVFAH